MPIEETDLQRYKVLICPHCKVIQGTFGKTMLVCKFCKKRTPFKKDGMYVVKIYGSYDSPTQAKFHIQRLKKEQYLNKK